MEYISKPHLVDLLRTFDRQRWLCPRIRYASVRSKGELIEDLRRHFNDARVGSLILFRPRVALGMRIPQIRYDLAARCFLIAGRPTDLPRESRKPVECQIERRPVTVDFHHPWAEAPGGTPE